LPIFTLAPTVITSSTTKTGWTIGGGFESSLGERWFARAEYRYADFGNASFVLSRSGPGLVASIVDNFDVGSERTPLRLDWATGSATELWL
jgi:outer membrane immunogenic protein